jgi:hypothetical protein
MKQLLNFLLGLFTRKKDQTTKKESATKEIVESYNKEQEKIVSQQLSEEVKKDIITSKPIHENGSVKKDESTEEKKKDRPKPKTRRGRPKNSDADKKKEERPAPKRRGRPKKNNSDKKNEERPAPKRRGRTKKNNDRKQKD